MQDTFWTLFDSVRNLSEWEKRKTLTIEPIMRVFQWAVLDLNQRPPACRAPTTTNYPSKIPIFTPKTAILGSKFGTSTRVEHKVDTE